MKNDLQLEYRNLVQYQLELGCMSDKCQIFYFILDILIYLYDNVSFSFEDKVGFYLEVKEGLMNK